MFEAIITFMVFSYLFVILLKYWVKNEWFGSKKNQCSCPFKDEEKDEEHYYNNYWR